MAAFGRRPKNRSPAWRAPTGEIESAAPAGDCLSPDIGYHFCSLQKADVHMREFRNSEVAGKLQAYPEHVRPGILQLRELIFGVAASNPDIGDLEETLKWGEPSYLAKHGSTVRIGWNESRPDHFAVYFNCNTKLVDTFKEIYSDLFDFEGNRAIVFHHEGTLPTEALEHCILLSLRYHKVKHLPLLGV